jgi:small subunit ribosomal protein S4e
VNDTVQVDLATGKVTATAKFEVGHLCTITGGANTGRTGTVTRVEYHDGNPTVVHVRDGANHSFATRLNNVFIIGKTAKPMISIPKSLGVKLSILEERDRKTKSAPAAASTTTTDAAATAV